jgi:hypothetical protein
MLLHEKGNRLQIYVSDPTEEASVMTATITTPKNKVDLVFNLPKNGMAGSTISKEAFIDF